MRCVKSGMTLYHNHTHTLSQHLQIWRRCDILKLRPTNLTYTEYLQLSEKFCREITRD